MEFHGSTSCVDGKARRHRFVRAAGVLAAALLLVACDTRPTPATFASDRVSTGYRLGPGDTLQIDVFGDDSVSGKYTIDGEGTVTMPLIGRVEAGGETPQELTARIGKKLTDFMHDPKVNVQLLSHRPVYIVGEVRQPGSYPFVDGMTVLKAVAIAGGFTYRAKTGLFVIDRAVNQGEPLAATPETPLLPGDVVTVQERYF
ncbi:MAG: polysaccharide biosynthesis protein [Rhodospirillales bacterium CG15_BIG_FIL_POST_REV_8_21_14_020_66_15]|nr:MAG: polysaccharide biosynthesis protein [Rhodospirillales bacterium CG15_BIG_FIL_POST_REV_8_21_14_020_66_15]